MIWSDTEFRIDDAETFLRSLHVSNYFEINKLFQVETTL